MLIAAAVVIVSSIVLSSAQPSPECITAFNATFNYTSEETTSCPTAYGALFFGNATNEQRTRVCDAGQQCNTMIENIIATCNNTIEYPTRLGQNLACTTGPNGTNCLAAYSSFENAGNDVLEMVGGGCFVGCTSSCMQNLVLLNNTLGCCVTELFSGLADNGTITSSHASFFINTYPEMCGLGTFTFCNGSALPRSPCSTATVSFFGENDGCSRATQTLLSGNLSALIYLYNGDCPTRFRDYVTTCSGVFGDELVQLANGIVATSQATAGDGRPCSDFAVLLAMDDDFEATCIRDVFLRQCSSSCSQALMNITAEYGCCFNTFVAEFYGRSNEVDDQIEFRILTNDVYDLCGVTSAGFCDATNPVPPYTSAAQQCISAGDSFFADNTCLDYYRALGLRSSATDVNNAANAICASEMCTNRVTSYINYLLTCRVGSILDDDDDDDDDDYEDGSLELASLTGTTTCRVDSNGNSCYSSIIFNPLYDEVDAAFDTDNPDAVCASTITESTCSSECSQFLTRAMDNVGCCLSEYAIASTGFYISEGIFQLCKISLSRCSGHSIPITNSLCGRAYIDLFTVNDECSRSAQSLFMGNESAIRGLLYGDCPTRFYNYASACRSGDDIDEIYATANAVFTITQARNSNGTSCGEIFKSLINDDDDDDDDDDSEGSCCIDYLFRRCSDACSLGFQYLTNQTGCCYNTIVGAFSGLRSKIYEQIQYAILTRDIYGLCGVTSGGFCTGVSVPPYTDAAAECVSAGDSFFADDTCLEYYRALGLRSSVTAVNNAANSICASQTCMDRMDSYINYLKTCRVGSIYNDDDDLDDDDDDDYDDSYLELANVIGNATCKIDNSKNSCYSSIYSNPLYAEIAAAFDARNPAAVCVSAVTEPTCPAECSQLLTRGLNTLGCCFVEWSIATTDPVTLQTVSRSCDISLDNRCSEIETVGGGGGGGANTQKGFGVLVVFLLGMIAIVLS